MINASWFLSSLLHLSTFFIITPNIQPVTNSYRFHLENVSGTCHCCLDRAPRPSSRHLHCYGNTLTLSLPLFCPHAHLIPRQAEQTPRGPRGRAPLPALHAQRASSSRGLRCSLTPPARQTPFSLRLFALPKCSSSRSTGLTPGLSGLSLKDTWKVREAVRAPRGRISFSLP